jgi:hypothetical protein
VVTTGAATIDWAVAGYGLNPANASDFSAMSGALSYADGDTVKQIVVNVTGDTTTEQDEEFQVTISNPSLDADILQATAQGVITNDDVLLAAQPITLPDATWGVAYSATGAATGWANGTYDLGNGITLSVTSQVYTASGTPY